MLVIIHGWSDSWEGMANLARQLVKHGGADRVAHIRLGDYVSMSDEVTFTDLAAGMQRAWRHKKLPEAPASVDLAVHSTGALVARQWMARYHEPDACPVKHLLMLAPANFGSPQAHKGRSFLGRLVKGFKADKPFQTGGRILRGLELASPYTWKLAESDLFTKDAHFGPGRVLATVLVGDTGYDGIRAMANQEGSDGTVRIAAANLNAARLEVDFASDPRQPTMTLSKRPARAAFCRVPGDNHSTIAAKGRWSPRNHDAMDLMVRALTVSDEDFDEWCDELDERNRREIAFGAGELQTHGFQHTVLLVEDDQGHPVTEYYLELFALTSEGDAEQPDLTRYLQEKVLRHVHVYGGAPQYRSFLVDCTALRKKFGERPGQPVSLSVSAHPELDENGDVGYRTFGWDDIGDLDFDPTTQNDMFQPDRTLMVRLVVRREQAEHLFRLRNAD